MPFSCEIKLNDPNGNGVYYAGQVVSGSVILNLSKTESIKCIIVTIGGFAYWNIVEQSSYNSTNTFEAREEYLSESDVILVDENYNDIILVTGHHEYNFSFDLPKVIPPSLESKHGHIRYRVCALIDRSRKSDIVRLVQFNVLIPLNLNAFDATIREPKCVEKNYKYFFSNDNKLELKIKLDRSGFAIGDIIRINVDANNLSTSDIDSITFTIDQCLLFATWKKCGKLITKFDRVEKCRAISNRLPRLKRTNFEHCLIVPYMPVSIYTSRVISVSYELTVNPSCDFTPIIIPIVIGNIPICDGK